MCDYLCPVKRSVPECLYLHWVAELRTAVAGVSDSISVSVCLHRVRYLWTVIQNVGNT